MEEWGGNVMRATPLLHSGEFYEEMDGSEMEITVDAGYE